MRKHATVQGVAVNRRIFFVLASLMIMTLSACTWDKEPVAFAPEYTGPAAIFEKEATIEVTSDDATPPQRADDAQMQETLWELGVQRGGEAIVNRFLRDPLILRGGVAAGRTISPLIERQGEFKARADEVTGAYSQYFTASGTLMPAKEFAGTVTAVEHDRYYSGQYDTIFLQLETPLPPNAQESFFLVAQTIPTGQAGYTRLVAGGRLYQVQDNVAQGRLLESLEEVEIGDTVFLMPLDLAPVAEAVPEPAEADADYPEVVVEPVTESPVAPQEPAETK
ncbi:hypothetical protein [Desulfohalobium retbaense]|uniref:Lipoprotein n=1 Tax=Desulfohalobium retbaense (strain ATCC 49708 / DSM 5692 / JCM 16813 / HR100) TaxID=485915 RepID=C8X2E0_DESRD|nr:hypothetical protein [Desulfohalobium retbaense]ACV68587.1 hypothetical protein Dret_1299 [Desulfohalobium retbaense DSM 5692]